MAESKEGQILVEFDWFIGEPAHSREQARNAALTPT
jgi:hypothetical protein